MNRTRLPPLPVYLLLAVVMLGRVFLASGPATVGYPNVDGMDTVMLRGLVARMLAHPLDAIQSGSNGIYFPVGYPVLELTPNLLDHLSAAPLVWALPFPLADNLWWLLVLVLNGVAGHRLGRRLGGSEAAGFLAGVAFMLCEPIAREANLHHAPQAMVFWAPLFLVAVLDLRAAATERDQLRAGALTGLWLAGAGLSYWYFALFLGLGALPLLVGAPWRALAAMAGVTGVLCAPGLLPFVLSWGDIPLTSGEQAPAPVQLPSSYDALPENLRFIAQHGNDPLFWLRRGPLDTSNRVSLVLIVAAALGARAWAPRLRWSLVAMAGLGAVMLLGPYLRSGQDLVIVGDNALRLPFQWLRDIHPFLARLTWPERWGILVPLGLVALAARAPRPGLLAGLVVLESLVVSGNLPLQRTSLRGQACWSALSATTGAVLELPLERPGLQAPRVGVHLRMHRRPVVNPVLLPPGASAPPAWNEWLEAQPLIVYLRTFESGKSPADPGGDAVRALRAAGVSAIAVDIEPGGIVTLGGVNRYRAGLGRHLGQPVDLGCALLWWMDGEAPRPDGLEDGDAWRTEYEAWRAAHPDPDLDTLIEPTWDAVRATALIE